MRRPIVFVLLAGLGALLAAFVVFSALHKREAEVQSAMARTTKIAVAAHDIALGAKIEKEALKLVSWSRDSVPAGGFTDPQAVIGAFAKSQFVTNEPLVASKLFIGEKTPGVMPLLIPSGMRAMSVPVDEVGDIAGFVQPHTRVDLLVAVAGITKDETSFSRIVLQNVEVIAVAQEIERVKDEPEIVKVVTLLVSPADAERLSLASREGTLRLAMRNYSDSKIVATSGIGMQNLMHGGAAEMPVMGGQAAAGMQALPVIAAARPAHLSSRGPTPFHLEIMRDGRSSEALSFINSARTGYRSNDRRGFEQLTAPHAAAPAISPPAPDASGTTADDSRSASLTGAVTNPLAAAAEVKEVKPADSHAPDRRTAPLRPGEPGYVAEPRTYEVR